MKYRWYAACIVALGLAITGAAIFPIEAQEGPQPSSGDSVAKPKKPAEAAPAAQPPIPSEFKRPDNVPPANSPTFEANATTVNVDVAVMDDHN
ncbi:MAG: VWA domain-containing protein, partial [Bryobacteraceae bacterium]